MWWRTAGKVRARSYELLLKASDADGVDVAGAGLNVFETFDISWAPAEAAAAGEVLLFTAGNFRVHRANETRKTGSGSGGGGSCSGLTLVWAVEKNCGRFLGLRGVDAGLLHAAAADAGRPEAPLMDSASVAFEELYRDRSNPVLRSAEARARAFWLALSCGDEGCERREDVRGELQARFDAVLGTESADVCDHVVVKSASRSRAFNVERAEERPLVCSSLVRCKASFLIGGARVSSIALTNYRSLVLEWTPSAAGVGAAEYAKVLALGEKELEELRKQFVVLDPEVDKKLSRAFLAVDTDRSGEIDKVELGVMLQLLAPPGHTSIVTQEEVDRVLAEMDSDGSGTVDFEEFRAWALSHTSFVKQCSLSSAHRLSLDAAAASEEAASTSSMAASSGTVGSLLSKAQPLVTDFSRFGKLARIYSLQDSVVYKEMRFWAVFVPHSGRINLFKDQAAFLAKRRHAKTIDVSRFSESSRSGAVVHLTWDRHSRKLLGRGGHDVSLEFASESSASAWDSALSGSIADTGKHSESKRVLYERYRELCQSLTHLFSALLESLLWE